MTDIHILYADGISAAGNTPEDAMDTFYSARQPFAVPSHFNHKNLKLGVIPDLIPEQGQSRAFALLQRITKKLPPMPQDTRLFLATTVGAIDILENAQENEMPDCTKLLLNEAKRLTGINDAILVAAACASGQTAIAMAARSIQNKRCTHALVIGIDITSEFVTGGFASLRAHSKQVARPYDQNRDGLTLGEGAGAMLLSCDTDNARTLGKILATCESCDASHVTAPDRSGNSLAALMDKTLQNAHLLPDDIAAIIGHGTGTPFNDASEIAAIQKLFTKIPLISIKGNTGHTLGATGVLQLVYALQFAKRKSLPPQAGLETPADDAQDYVSTSAQPLRSNRFLSLNVGFGGLNSTVIMEAQP